MNSEEGPELESTTTAKRSSDPSDDGELITLLSNMPLSPAQWTRFRVTLRESWWTPCPGPLNEGPSERPGLSRTSVRSIDRSTYERPFVNRPTYEQVFGPSPGALRVLSWLLRYLVLSSSLHLVGTSIPHVVYVL